MFYRIEKADGSPKTAMNPSSFWESVNEEVTDVEIFLDRNRGEFNILKSKIAELCFSKTLGGCFASLFSSMVISQTNFSIMKDYESWHVYTCNQQPCIDLANFEHLDFKYTEEVRYRKPIHVNYIGDVQIDDTMCNLIQEIARIGFERPHDLIYTEHQTVRLTELVNKVNQHLKQELQITTMH